METYTMLLDWKNQCCQNDHTIQRNLQIQYNLYETIAFFTELEEKNLWFVWKHERLWTARAILRKKNRAEKSDSLTSDYTTKPQSSKQGGTGTKTEV